MNKEQALQRIAQIQMMLKPKSIGGALLGGSIGYVLGKKQFGINGAGLGLLGGLIAGFKVGTQKELSEVQRLDLELELHKLYDIVNSSVSGINSETVLNTGQVENLRFDLIPFTGQWLDFIGSPSKNFHALVFGKPKQGKSIFCIKFASYLAENFGRVLYVAAEEGIGPTLKQKLTDFQVNSKNLDIAGFREYDKIADSVESGRYKFVFIDSVNYAKISVEQLELLKKENPNVAFITIQQSTKDGKFRGSQEFAHNCDIIITVESGIAKQQGRFNTESEMTVFEKRKPGRPLKETSKPVYPPVTALF